MDEKITILVKIACLDFLPGQHLKSWKSLSSGRRTEGQPTTTPFWKTLITNVCPRGGGRQVPAKTKLWSRALLGSQYVSVGVYSKHQMSDEWPGWICIWTFGPPVGSRPGFGPSGRDAAHTLLGSFTLNSFKASRLR